MKRCHLFDYLNLGDIGFIELLFALIPMLSGFSLSIFPLSVFVWILLMLVVFIRKRKMQLGNYMPITIFFVFWCVHEIYILIVDEVNINGLISQIIYFIAFMMIFPILDYRKLLGSLNLVAVISIAGLLFQWLEILKGNGIHPLEIPGLSMSEERLERLSFRPSSFFLEPAAYVSYMICPLALSFIEKKYIWSVLLILSIFLTTSTTGIALSFILLVTSMFFVGKSRMSFILGIFLSIGLFFSLTHFEVFKLGVEKAEKTTWETERLSQGPYIVSTMQAHEYVFGVPYSTAYHYCKAGRATKVTYFGENVYISTFWDIILRFGLIGLFLYLATYIKLVKQSKLIWPLLICIIATIFTDPDGIQGSFIFKLIIMLVIVSKEKNKKFGIKPHNINS